MTIIAIDPKVHKAKAAQLPRPCIIIGDDMRETGMLESIVHYNSTTGAAQGEIPIGGAKEIDEAVRAARLAFPAWRDMKPARRRQILDRLADLIALNMPRFMDMAVLENGVPMANMIHGMASRVLDWTRYYAGWADKIEGIVTGVNPGDHFEYTFPEPYGVIGHVITWNAPLLSLAMKVSPSLAAGNCVVVKPAEFTPFSAQLFTELALEAGVPAGVINVVPGRLEAGEALVAHRGVDKISFTGGPVGAKAIMRSAADTLKPLVFELGGKSANLIFPDVDIEATAAYCAYFGVSNSGQGCALPTRILIHRSIYDRFLDAMVGAIGSIPTGDPFDERTIVGPMANRAAQARVTAMIDEARRTGAGRFLIGGGDPDEALSTGSFVPPTLIADVDPSSRIAQTEIFGPVLVAMPFDSEEDAVALANGTDYGLAAYVQTNDLNIAQRMARQLSAGSVFINKATPSFLASTPFGGNNISGFGREGGKAGLDEFIRTKAVAMSIA